ncbi:MAG: hypothetical protein GTO63_32975 [Anaerolineae bacterium]|nr:hypothetical protein [Anaerolineae bacterium]NIN99464.1 hypothetical protein [Anaerolineae bacterium]NIQ82329.1 hypothetical protein [Anaerolineae bacterium]
MDTRGFVRWLVKGILIIGLLFGLLPLVEGRLRHRGVLGLLVVALVSVGLIALTYSWYRWGRTGDKRTRPSPFTENTGESIEEAILIRSARNQVAGVALEYAYLKKRFGRRGEDWELDRQVLVKRGDRHYDEMRLRFPDGTSRTIYFDITAFFGEF